MTGGSTKENLEKPSLPSDWSIKKLRELCSQIQDGTHFTPQYVEYGIPFYSVESVTARNFLVSKYVTQEAHDVMARRCRPQRGDILMTRIGSLGDTAVVDWDHEASIYVSLALLRPGKAIDEAYLYAYTRSKAFVTEVESRSLPNAIPKKINLGDIGDVEIWVPDSLHEQQAIAAALSDADGVVAGLERVIAKKRLIKQGAMQDLLTARRRLPGFSGEWEVKRLGEVARVATGGRNNQDKDPMGEYPFFVRSDTVERIRSFSYDCEAILVPGEGRIGEIFHYINGRFDVHQRVYCISAFSEGTSGRFIYFVLRQFFGAHAMINTVKATVDSLRRPTFTGFEFRCPPSFDEQQAITAVLSDMDAEIQTLEARLAKARAVKEGMMQNLLTGRVRLV